MQILFHLVLKQKSGWYIDFLVEVNQENTYVVLVEAVWLPTTSLV